MPRVGSQGLGVTAPRAGSQSLSTMVARACPSPKVQGPWAWLGTAQMVRNGPKILYCAAAYRLGPRPILKSSLGPPSYCCPYCMAANRLGLTPILETTPLCGLQRGLSWTCTEAGARWAPDCGRWAPRGTRKVSSLCPHPHSHPHTCTYTHAHTQNCYSALRDSSHRVSLGALWAIRQVSFQGV